MGNETSGSQNNDAQEKQTLKVANLNFSGYESSPFEYYSEDHIFEQEQLNNIFQQTLRTVPQKIGLPDLYNKERMKEISSIDKVLKTTRYSPLYNKQCGVKNGKFVDLPEFVCLWYAKLALEEGWRKLKKKPKKVEDKEHAREVSKNPKQSQKKGKDSKDEGPSKSFKQIVKKAKDDVKQKVVVKDKIKDDGESMYYSSYQECEQAYSTNFELLMGFDFMIYASILRYVYENSEIDNIIKDRSCAKYLGFMNQFFSKTFLNRNKKIYETIEFILKNDIDVLFVQEATGKLCDELEKRDPGYRFIMSKERPDDPGISVVIFKEKSFPKADIGRKSNLKLQQIFQDKKLADKVDSFLIWGKSAFISLDNFILISAHMKQFTEAVENDLKIISEKFPTKYVIAGGTFSNVNRKYAPTKTGSKYILFPQDLVTCYKMRTSMQFQKGKEGQIVKTQNNFILYDSKLVLTNKQKKFVRHKHIQNGVFTVDGTEFKAKVSEENTPERSALKIANFDFLPSYLHPFDQMIVVKTVRIPKKQPHNSTLTPEQKKKKKQERERLGFETSSSEQEEPSKPALDSADTNDKEQSIL